MTTLQNLSVAEMDGISDALGLRLIDQRTIPVYGTLNRGKSTIRSFERKVVSADIRVDGDYGITIVAHSDNGNTIQHNEFKFDKVDLDKLIEFLQEAKQFASEEQVYKKLAGIQKSQWG